MSRSWPAAALADAGAHIHSDVRQRPPACLACIHAWYASAGCKYSSPRCSEQEPLTPSLEGATGQPVCPGWAHASLCQDRKLQAATPDPCCVTSEHRDDHSTARWLMGRCSRQFQGDLWPSLPEERPLCGRPAQPKHGHASLHLLTIIIRARCKVTGRVQRADFNELPQHERLSVNRGVRAWVPSLHREPGIPLRRRSVAIYSRLGMEIYRPPPALRPTQAPVIETPGYPAPRPPLTTGSHAPGMQPAGSPIAGRQGAVLHPTPSQWQLPPAARAPIAWHVVLTFRERWQARSRHLQCPGIPDAWSPRQSAHNPVHLRLLLSCHTGLSSTRGAVQAVLAAPLLLAVGATATFLVAVTAVLGACRACIGVHLWSLHACIKLRTSIAPPLPCALTATQCRFSRSIGPWQLGKHNLLVCRHARPAAQQAS